MKNKLFGSLSLLLIVFSTAAYAQTAERGNIYALVVGVSEYATPGNDLQFPAKDATQVYDLLKGHTTPDKIVMITNAEATHDNILSSASRLFASATPNDMVLLYFSGHGYTGGWMAHDTGVDYAELKKLFKRIKARKLIFADACFAGVIREDDPTVVNAQTAMGKQRVCLFLSSRSDQYSLESPLLDNGFFTFYLLAGLRGGADANRDKIITALELFEFVNPRVKEQSQGIQVPVMWGRFEDRMEILNWN
jgi:uncharacterized caspase-like protein